MVGAFPCHGKKSIGFDSQMLRKSKSKMKDLNNISEETDEAEETMPRSSNWNRIQDFHSWHIGSIPIRGTNKNKRV